MYDNKENATLIMTIMPIIMTMMMMTTTTIVRIIIIIAKIIKPCPVRAQISVMPSILALKVKG